MYMCVCLGRIVWIMYILTCVFYNGRSIGEFFIDWIQLSTSLYVVKQEDPFRKCCWDFDWFVRLWCNILVENRSCLTIIPLLEMLLIVSGKYDFMAYTVKVYTQNSWFSLLIENTLAILMDIFFHFLWWNGIVFK